MDNRKVVLMTADPTGFPVDDATLIMLAAACEINPDTGRTHLSDFLDMGTRETSRELVDDIDDIPVYEVKYEPGYEPFSPHHVIQCLVAEIQRLRTNESGGA